MRFRKRPVEVEAMQFTDEMKDRVHTWVTCTTAPSFDGDGNPSLRILTPEGVATTNIGDYIVKDTWGNFRPVKPEEFAQTYEAEPRYVYNPITQGYDDAHKRGFTHAKQTVFEIPDDLRDQVWRRMRIDPSCNRILCDFVVNETVRAILNYTPAKPTCTCDSDA